MRNLSGRKDQKSPSARSGRAFVLATALTALSGAAGLSHELIWTRRLTDMLGTGFESSARVFGCFFLGLALGSAWASRQVARIGRPWRATAIAEITLALLSLPILLLPEWTGWIWPAIGPENLAGRVGSVVKWAVSLLVVLPPATAMGAILPLLAAATLDGPRRLDRHGVWLYVANTFGGVVGLAATVLVLLPELGTIETMLLAMCVNVGIAVVLLLMDRGRSRSTPEISSTVSVESRGDHQQAATAVVAFFSGAGVLSAEVIGLDLVMLAAPLSFYAPAAVLTAVILALGLAAMVVPTLRSRQAAGVSRLPFLLSTGGLALTITPLAFMLLLSISGPLVGESTLIRFFLRLVVITSGGMGPALIIIGQIFPESVAIAAVGGDAGSRARRLGRLLAWNGLGGFLGAEITYRVILPCFGVHGGMAILGLLYLLAGLFVSVASSKGRQSRSMLRAATVFLVGGSITFGLIIQQPHVNPHLGFKVLDQRFGREGAVAVVQNSKGARSILLSNQYVLGSTDARWDQERQAHLALLLHPNPRRVAFVGLATGITPGAALDHPMVESVTAVEVSPLVVRAADRWFSEWNHALTRQPRVQILVEDGRTYLASCSERFDVIVGDLYLPWGPGESRLFSVEHFTAARRALRQGGVYCQWVPMYQLTPPQIDLILSSFGRAFPRTHLIRNGLASDRPVLGLVGFRDADLDWAVISRRCAEVASSHLILDLTARHPEAIAMLYLGALSPRDSGASWNSLANMALESDASRQRVTGNPGRKYIFGERFLDWAGRVVPASEAALNDEPIGDSPAPLRGLMRLGLELSAWMSTSESSGRHGSSPKRSLPLDLARSLLPALLLDTEADWARWSGPDLRLDQSVTMQLNSATTLRFTKVNEATSVTGPGLGRVENVCPLATDGIPITDCQEAFSAGG